MEFIVAASAGATASTRMTSEVPAAKTLVGETIDGAWTGANVVGIGNGSARTYAGSDWAGAGTGGAARG